MLDLCMFDPMHRSRLLFVLSLLTACDGSPAPEDAAIDAAIDPTIDGGTRDGGADAPIGPIVLAEGVTLEGLALFQGVRVGLAEGGVIDTTPNAPILAARDAVVRAYARTTTRREITAELEVTDGARIVAVHRDTITLDGASSDALPSSVLSFDLPATEVTETTRIAVRLIDPTGTPAPSTAHPARLPRDGSGLPLGAMDDGEGLDLVLVPLRYDTDGSRRLPDTSDAWLGQLRGLLTSLYPLVDVQITVREPVPWTRGLTFTGNVDFGAINAMLRDLRDTDRARPGSYYYAIVAPDDTFSAYCGGSCVTGQSYVVDAPEDDNFRVGSGVDFGTEDSAWTAAHEIGHEFGRYHAPCDTSGADVDYPYAGGAIGVWGYDPRSRTFLPPTTTDFMGYCDPQWISDYTWSAMFTRNLAVTPLSSSSSGRSAARTPMLLVRTGGEAGTVMVGVRTVRPPRTAATRFYRYLDARGRVLAFGSAPALSSSHTSELLVSLPTPPLGAALLELDGDAISL
jgi:hypothetical protein